MIAMRMLPPQILAKTSLSHALQAVGSAGVGGWKRRMVQEIGRRGR
jgi:hypothetical protein